LGHAEGLASHARLAFAREKYRYRVACYTAVGCDRRKTFTSHFSEYAGHPIGELMPNPYLLEIAFAPLVSLPQDFNTNLLMLFRWVHFLAGITWVGLLYFFNLVNVPFMAAIDANTRGKVVPTLMPRALWWFRWSSVITVVAGIGYWGSIVGTDAQNAGVHGGSAMASFFILWTVTWAILYALLIPGKGILDKGPVLAVLVSIIVIAASWLYLRLNDHGWESNRMLAIGIGGGLGWVMMLNVWGVVWRIQKRLIQWTRENAATGTPIPEKSKRMARMAFLTSRISAFLTVPLLFLMGAASHYPMFGR
jgi:uncharacterized membrane protein